MTSTEAQMVARAPGRVGWLTRSFTSAQAFAAICGWAVVALPATVNGGYFPTSWGWEGSILLAVAAVALAIRGRIHLGRWELVALVAAAGLLGWTILSIVWAASATWPVREDERLLVYAAALLAMLLVVRRAGYRMLLSGVWAGIATVCCYGLATRLFPGWRSNFDSFGGYRLSEPIGYWNGLGILAAMGVLLALGLAARAESTAMRVIAAASVPLLATTLYFTYSRGAWIALAIGLVAAFTADARRLQLVTSTLIVGAWATLGVGLASQSVGLTHVQASRTTAAHDGHRLAIELAALGVASALSAVLFTYAEKRVSIPRRVRIIYAIALVVVLVASLTTVFARYGDPATLARKGYQSLDATPPGGGTNLNQRLLSVSSAQRIDHWRVAWQDYRQHPWLGSGAGTYEQHWMQARRSDFHVRNAHNLYLETLATLGPVGLALLVIMLVAPLLALVRTRRSGVGSIACGAYVAFLLHAAIDWDWQIPAVTLGALACGVALLVAARGVTGPRALSLRSRISLAAVVLVLFGAALIGLRGNLAIAASNNAAADRNWSESAQQARKATRWAPWSSEALQLLGNAQYALGKRSEAYRTLMRAAHKDPNNWSIWYDVGNAAPTTALELTAYRRAAELNPRGPDIGMLRAIHILPSKGKANS